MTFRTPTNAGFGPAVDPDDGGEHYSDCPLHEDKEHTHECRTEYMLKRTTVWMEFEGMSWRLKIHNPNDLSFSPFLYVRIDYCPWCGEELETPQCECNGIRAAYRERALDAKADAQMEEQLERKYHETETLP